jgi:hypothetical protein
VDEIEALLVKSLEVARQQGARCWELRTACDLARLWHGRGRSAEALGLVSSIYGTFSEGFETADLQDARTLMDVLRQAAPARQPRRNERHRVVDGGRAAVVALGGATVGGATWASGHWSSEAARRTSR